MPLNQLLEIISSDELNVKCEEIVYKTVIYWIKYDLNERKNYLGQLLNYVRLPLLDIKYLVTHVSRDPLIKTLSISDPNIAALIDEAKDYHLLPQDRSLNQSIRTKPRKYFGLIELLFAIGGWYSVSNDFLNSKIIYNLTHLISKDDAMDSVEMLDPVKNSKWQTVASMGTRRRGMGICVLNQQIYVVGGHDGFKYLNSVECFCPSTNIWQTNIKKMPNVRNCVGVCCFEGALYVIGGFNATSCLKVVERYDPNFNQWSNLAPMNSMRSGLKAVVLNDLIYAIGGSDGSSTLKTAE